MSAIFSSVRLGAGTGILHRVFCTVLLGIFFTCSHTAFAGSLCDSIPEGCRCAVLAEQAQTRIVIMDMAAQKNIWEWKPQSSNVKPAHFGWFSNLSEVKPVYNNSCLLITASGGAVALIRIADKKTLFYAYAGGNTHSAELLPDGNIVTASSNGACLTVFATDTSGSGQAGFLSRQPMPFAHNVVWDKERRILWSAGMNQLKIFRYNFNCLQPAIEAIDSIALPGTEAHDLFPEYGTANLWLTNTTHVYRFHTVNRQLTEAEGMQKNIKSVSSGPAGYPVLMVLPNESWWTDTLLDNQGHPLFHEKGMRIYKARWLLRNTFSYRDQAGWQHCREQ